MNPTARVIDGITGMPGLTEMSHHIPQKTYCFFQDRVNIPEQLPNGLPKPGDRCYYGLLTTGEGMNQKLWTMSCACGILESLYDLGYKVEVMAAGDNILVVVYLNPGDVPAYAQADVLSALNKMADDIGLPIKLEETYTSNRYFEYGKSPYFDGKKVSMALKKASRIGTEMQETVPSMNARLSSIFSTGVSVAAEDVSPIPAYVVSVLESYCVINDYKDIGRIPPEILTLMMLITRSLGGLKVTNYASFCIRGIQDGACQNLDILRSVQELEAVYPKLMQALRVYPVVAKQCSFASIVRDPYCLSLAIRPDAETEIRSIIEEKLPGIVKNKDIAPLLSMNAKREEGLLVNDLKGIHPPSLKLMASIFQYSNVAQREKAISRFQSSSSVNTLIQGETDMPVLYSNSISRDKELIESYTKRSSKSFFRDIDFGACPTYTLNNYRRQMTGMELVNPSGPPPTHQIEMLRWDDVPLDQIPYTIKVHVHESFSDFLIKRGKHPIYLGSETRIKRAKTSLEMFSTDPLDRVVLSVAELSTWVGDDVNIQKLLSVLISEKTQTHPDDIKTTCRQIIGGSFEHRGHLMTIPTGAFCNFDPSVMSHISIITDSAINFTKKHDNYSIMFQLLKVAIGSRVTHMYYSGIDPVGEWGAVLRCRTCTELIYDGNYSLQFSPTYFGIPIRLTIMKYSTTNTERLQSPAYEAGHAYFGYKLAKSILDWDHIERVSETDTVDRYDIHHNTSVNLTELSRLKCTHLLGYAMLFLALDSGLWESFKSKSYMTSVTSFSPMEYFMNTLLMAGHGQNLISLTGGVFGYTLDDPNDRCRVFLYIVQRIAPVLIRSLRVLLPEFDDITNSRIMKLILVAREVECHDVTDFDRLFVRGGFLMAPPEDVSVREIRAHASTTALGDKCILSRIVLGGVPIPMKRFVPSHSSTYGTTAFASQIWSFAHKLPCIDTWIINDHGGDIGVVLGHSSRHIFVHDPSPRRYEKVRITNGPRTLYLDRCTDSYVRSYYIKYLGVKWPQRPVKSKLLIISAKDPREMVGIGAQIHDDDIILSRESVGGALMGFPRRYENDLWYLSSIPETLQHPREIGLPHPKVSYYTDHPLAPWYRLKKYLKVETINKESVSKFINNEIIKWTNDTGMISSADCSYISYIRENIHERKQLEEVLLLHWMLSRLKGNTTPCLYWHVTEVGTLHVDCFCDRESTTISKYYPKDELMTVLLVYICKQM